MTVVDKVLPEPAEYLKESKELDVIWNDFINRGEDARSKIVRMVEILESNGYTRTQAVEKVESDHKYLKGFSRSTIYRALPDDKKRKYESSNDIIMLPDNSDVSNDTFEDLETSITENNNNNHKSKIQLSKPVLNFAKKMELSPNKLKLIDKHHNRLKDHPKLEKKLVKEIAPLTMEEAKIKVNQEIMDLETGATVKDGDSYVIDYSKREKIDTKIQRDKSAPEYYLELVETLTTLLYQSTGYRLNQFTTTYEPKHVENTEKHRIEILKGLTSNELKKLENDLDILDEVTQSWLDLIHREIMYRKNR